jgi:DNA end-binding protein Ku
VQLHSALHYKDISFNLLHKECKSRIKQQTYCPTCDRTIDRSELVKGYEYSKDQYVIMEDADFDKVEVSASRNIDVMAFVDLKSVDPIYFSRPYFLTPEPGSEKTFTLLVRAMEKSHKVGVVRYVMRGKEYVGCVAPRGKGLLLFVMYHQDEVKDIGDFSTDYKVALRDKEVTLAEQLIDNLTEDFSPEMLKDNYREKLMEILDQKMQGRAIALAPAKRPPAKVVNLMDALKKSVMETAKAKHKPAVKVQAVREKKRKKA